MTWHETRERPRLPCSRRHDSPPRGLAWADLAELERRLVCALLVREEASIGELCREVLGRADGTARLRVRNALRIVARERYVARVARGRYVLRASVPAPG